MTKTEFENFLIKYKEFTEISKKVFRKEFPQEENFNALFIRDGRILVEGSWDTTYDITKKVISELTPDINF